MKTAVFILGILILPLAFSACVGNGDSKTATPPLGTQRAPGDTSSSLGFYDLNAPNIPPAVRAAASSVVYIAAAGGSLQTAAEKFGDAPLGEIILRIQSTPLQPGLSQDDKDVFLYQLNTCFRKRVTAWRCRVYEGIKYSSGYLVGDGSRIRTARHAISDIAASGDPVPVFVSDFAGRRIWAPNSGGAVALFRSRNPTRVNDFTLPNDDVAEIQLSRPVGQPLIAMAMSAQVGEPVYIIGFPQRSEDRARFGLPDAPGAQLRISQGEVISMEMASQKQGVAPSGYDQTDQILLPPNGRDQCGRRTGS
jgi:hypothetical protein